MKVIFEFDTESEHFDYCQLELYKNAEHLLRALSAISDQLRTWYKWDERDAIPTEEIREKIVEIINEHVNLEKLGY